MLTMKTVALITFFLCACIEITMPMSMAVEDYYDQPKGGGGKKEENQRQHQHQNYIMDLP